MAGEDDDKTVFGGPLPGSNPAREPGPRPASDGWGRPPVPGGGGHGSPASAQPLAPFSPPYPAPGSSAPQGDGASPFGGPGMGAAGPGQTWLGRPAPAPVPGSNAGQIGRAAGPDRGFFPDIAAPQSTPTREAPRIPLFEALQVRDLGAGSSSNPILASAASLLILLGRLRTGMVELQVAPLMEHVTREIDRFERNAVAAGVSPHEALVAKYALSGTADDIVQNLPGSDRGNWQQYSMVARFFHKRDSGVGFFQEAEKAMHAPAQQYNLLELMLVCLSLGFEGQFRTMPNGAAELSRIRSAIYESLRRVNPRPDEDISVMWTPVVQDRGRRFAAIPLPAVLGVGVAALVALFAVFATLINRDGAAAAETMRAIHRGAPALQIDRTDPGPAFVAEVPQLDRIRTAFQSEIADGRVGVEVKGDYIAIRVGNLQLFDLGQVEVKPGFADLAARIAEVLNAEGGPILIEGHTDSVPLTGRGQFKDNYQLSTARAEGVAEVLGPLLSDPARMRVEGRGEDDPVADNATEEGQSANRRVEILLAREGSYDPAPASPDGENVAPQEPTETAN
ncbi:type IVB secretion system protein IcmH/DotU [Paracoccus sp. Ld10]|uniref:type IVB secretion system protein IcmH/DotU n=1 Tax=Paracoccus sp. Ld10 TaxID=649158 RepID=UPI003867631A